GNLTREYSYIGPAWYQKKIVIPQSWQGKVVQLFLERVLWESRIYLDGKPFGAIDAMGTPHIHNFGMLEPGEHIITIRVNNDMIHNIGDKGHIYTAYTQSIWNGIVGRIELRATNKDHIVSLKAFPDIDKDELKVKVVLNLSSDSQKKYSVKLEISDIESKKVVLNANRELNYDHREKELKIQLPVENKLEQWDEFNPKLYEFKCYLEKENKIIHQKEIEFGYTKVSHNGTHILLNNKPVFLRGNLDCVHFPLTGYPSCKVEDWERIFRSYKEYGLNHVRFHSWCPPEAAFKTADRLGIYIQAEVIWLDWWMNTDMVAEGRPEMDTKGHPPGLGYDVKRDSFVVAEINRIINTYGNHPSFVMFCIGNELGNSDFNIMETWISKIKKADPRRLYALSTARKITATDDYSATHHIMGLGRTRGLNGPRTDWNFEESYGKANIPIIAHEIGQWPVYPLWAEIEKYTGVLKARNLEQFREIARKNGIFNQNQTLHAASGALNQIMYKYEIESFLRTPGCAGVQLLSMQDYQGQGEALIGWLDCFWDSKGITTPEKFREHFNTTVPLLQMEKFIWTNNEIFSAQAQISHFGENDLKAICTYTITDESGKIIFSNKFTELYIKRGSLTDLSKISFSLAGINYAQKLTIRLEIDNTTFANEWNIWVFPDKTPKINTNNILVANEWDEHILDTLNAGGKVLFIANQQGTELSSVDANFYPLYWSLSFFPGQGKTNIGLLLQDDHPAFKYFPTSSHSNWQWEAISNDAKGFILNHLPADYKPIAQPVDDFHRNNKVGSIFELKVGKGKLLVCGYPIFIKDNPVSKQLYYSLIRYVNSEEFDPVYEIDPDSLKEMF
ncbi:MAG: glycoside hydrolase family 2 TIM barrel-domain containing protein, partial [Bacteroidota bacterium]|nr:glycoside hydrolase family 2 TIM barrel-domain containing protein [Bacteroidota bacterium]